MASKSEIDRYARNWLDYYSESTEPQLRHALLKRFPGATLGPDRITENMLDGAIEANQANPDPGGCLPALVFAPVLAAWHRRYPSSPTRLEDIDAVLAELRDDGRWPDS